MSLSSCTISSVTRLRFKSEILEIVEDEQVRILLMRNL